MGGFVASLAPNGLDRANVARRQEGDELGPFDHDHRPAARRDERLLRMIHMIDPIIPHANDKGHERLGAKHRPHKVWLHESLLSAQFRMFTTLNGGCAAG
jgi:hypothetical protein